MPLEARKMAQSGGRSALHTRAAIGTRTAGRVLAVATATCLALAGCSSTDPGTANTGPVTLTPAAGSGSLPDPCSLLTPADIAAAAGVTMADGVINTELSNDTQSICEWKPEGGFPFVQVIVVGGADQVSTQRATAEAMMGASADVTVPGARDAYCVANGTILGMAAGDYFIQVSYMSTGSADVSAITSVLATDAAAALS